MKSRRLYPSLFVALLLIYTALNLVNLPADTASRYGLGPLQTRLLLLTIVVPFLIIWSAAFFGYIRLKHYAEIIVKSQEGKALHYIAKGLGWLAFGLPALSVSSRLLNMTTQQHPGFRPTYVITQNYLNLALYLISFTLISRGAYLLIQAVKKKPNYSEQHFWVLLHIILAVVYTYLVINRPLFPQGEQSIYYLPNWLILATLVVPYLYLWYLGLRSAYRMYFFHKMVKGLIYRRAMAYLATGIYFIISSTIILQFVTTLSARLTDLSLVPLLLTVYGLLIIIAAGYLLVALGAKRLKKLEEV